MPTHKITNEFIRKYNKQFAIKGYSKLSVSEKVKTIQNYVGKPGMSGMKRDWKAIMDKYPGYSGSAAKAPLKTPGPENYASPPWIPRSRNTQPERAGWP
jgi:hypothetical protein